MLGVPRLTRRLLAGALIIAASLSAAATASAAKPKAAKPKVTVRMLNNHRYCEVLAVHGTFPNLLADVWNTYGLNNCPPGPWQAQDETALASELGALAVRLNGPRYLADRPRLHPTRPRDGADPHPSAP